MSFVEDGFGTDLGTGALGQDKLEKNHINSPTIPILNLLVYVTVV